MTRLLMRSDEPVSFSGEFSTLRDAPPTPRPSEAVPICIGGKGPERTQLAARAGAGCDEVMLQWLWLDDLDGIAAEMTLERTA